MNFPGYEKLEEQRLELEAHLEVDWQERRARMDKLNRQANRDNNITCALIVLTGIVWGIAIILGRFS